MWKKAFLVIFIFWLSVDFVSGQNLPGSHYKYQQTQQVLKSIGRATGNIRTIPSLRLSKLDNFIAEYDPHTIEIVVSESFYDLCAGFGKDSLNALACILGHELGHYYLDHQYSGGFNEILGTTKNDGISLEHKKIMEAKADIFGLKHAFLAGFDSYQVMPEVLEMIYHTYQVSSSPNYPTKNQRLDITHHQVAQLKPLIYVFETALLLHMNQHLKEALLLYDYLLRKDLVSAEILNNIGSIYLQRALKIKDVSSRSDLFLYPCEISPGDRLRNLLNQRGVTDTEHNKRDHFLTDAEKYLLQARDRNKNAAASYMNLATLNMIRENHKAAHRFLDKLQQEYIQLKKVLPPNYYLLRGIAFTLQKDFSKANTYLNMAKSKGAYEAEANLNAFEQYRGNHAVAMQKFIASKIDFITSYLEEENKNPGKTWSPIFDLRDGDFSLKEMIHINFDEKISNATVDEPFYLNYNSNGNGLLKAKVEFSDKTLYFIRANQRYEGITPADVKIGDSNQKLVSRHGPGDNQYRLSHGSAYTLYWKKEISNTGLMVESKNNKVVSMLFFTVN